MDLQLKDKTAVVTGASRGIGRAIAMELAREGAQVACVATAAERVMDTVAAVESFGGRARAYGANVASMSSMKALAGQIQEDWGAIDILVNNAGITRDGLLLRMSEEDWDSVMDVNLKGTFNACKVFAKTLMKRRGARVINISSVVGLNGNGGQANYAASKAGVIAFTKSMARELGARQVRVNAVAPGFIETDMTEALGGELREDMKKAIPLQRFGQAAEVARLVSFLAGETGSYITGQVFVIDGGMAI